jgi:hypothetical protein
MLLVGEWNWIEWFAGACAAAVGATLAEIACSATLHRLHVPLDRIAAAWTVPGMIVVDTGIVLWALLRCLARFQAPRGRFIARPYAGDARRADDRAWTVLAANYSPNSFVVDVDADAETVLVHDLVPFRKSEEPA